MKHRLIIFGTSSFGLPSFTYVADDPAMDVVSVVTQPARPTGRRQALTPSAIAQWAQQRQIPLLTPATLKSDEAREHIAAVQADTFLVAAYGLILPASILHLASTGSMNIHASLLPRYRGASPIAAALANGDTATGVTFMLMDEGCDTGPVLEQHEIPIHPAETRPQLETRLSTLAAAHITTVLHHWWDGKLRSQPQGGNSISQAPRLKRTDGQATWDDALSWERKTRAYLPWPGVWSKWGDREMKILSATAESTTINQHRGTIVQHGPQWAVVCQRGLLIPSMVQVSGRQPQPAASLPGSYPGFIGSVLS